MQGRRSANERSKVKIGTIIDKGIMDKLKERSAREGKAISALIEEAVLKYENDDTLVREMRLKAMEQLFSIRFNISDEDWNTIMEEDYYEQ